MGQDSKKTKKQYMKPKVMALIPIRERAEQALRTNVDVELDMIKENEEHGEETRKHLNKDKLDFRKFSIEPTINEIP